MTIYYGKETNDETWQATLDQEDNRWILRQFISTPLGWEPMGHDKQFLDKRVAETTLIRLGYSRVA
jgi:hypothetical protein